MLSRALLLAVVLVVPTAALAQPRPMLKADVTVSDELVRIGDLVANAGAVADVAIFRAPDLGSTGLVPTARIIEAIRPHRLTGIDTGGLTDVTVSRASRVISLKDIEMQVAAALADQTGADPMGLAVTFDRDARALHVEAAAASAVRVARAHFEPGGRFEVTLDIPGSTAARRLPLRYTGSVVETVAFATLSRPLQRGEVVRDSDVTVERRAKHTVGTDSLASINHVVGMAARRTLRPGQPLRAADLMKPELVRQHETVTIHYEVPGVVLSVRGKALESGAEGDLVNVLNVQSKRTIQGTVSGVGRVSVRSLAPRIVEAVAIARTASLPAPSAPLRTE